MIKVLELIEGGFLGGGHTHVLSLTRNLDKLDFDPIIAASPIGAFKDEVAKYSLKFRDIIIPKFYKKEGLNELLRIVDEENIKFIHAHGGVAAMYAVLAKKRRPFLKVIHSIHGIHFIHRNFIIRNISHLIEKRQLPYKDKFICVSENDLRQATELKVIDKNKTIIIKYGIDLNRFRAVDNPELRVKLGFHENDIIIGNIMRFDFQKNQRFLIKAFAELSKKYPNLKLLLAGDGRLKTDCEKQVNDLNLKQKVIFTGEIKEPQNYYSLFDIFIFPSLWEGLPITIMEGMASGRCMAVSDLKENQEMITDGYNGLIFDVKNVNSLVEKIEILLADMDLRKKLSENALKESVNYSVENMTRKIEKLYKEVFKNS
ncbi:glycosyltransferase family 1 protein [soil metagenome]